MGKFIRLASGVLCLGVLSLGVVYFDPACPLTYPALNPYRSDSVGEIMAQSEMLGRLQGASDHRIAAKEEAAREVIAGRRSLADAMLQFRALDQEWPQFGSGPEKAASLRMSEDEWDGQGVINYVRKILADRPDEAAAIVGRLEVELQELLADRNKRPSRRRSYGQSRVVEAIGKGGR